MAASAALCKPYSTSKQKLSAPICSTLLDDSGLYLCRKKLSYAIIKITGLISLKRGGRKRWFWRLDFKNHISTFFGFCIERNGEMVVRKSNRTFGRVAVGTSRGPKNCQISFNEIQGWKNQVVQMHWMSYQQCVYYFVSIKAENSLIKVMMEPNV